jgi:hypothetical protein
MVVSRPHQHRRARHRRLRLHRRRHQLLLRRKRSQTTHSFSNGSVTSALPAAPLPPLPPPPPPALSVERGAVAASSVEASDAAAASTETQRRRRARPTAVREGSMGQCCTLRDAVTARDARRGGGAEANTNDIATASQAPGASCAVPYVASSARRHNREDEACENTPAGEPSQAQGRTSAARSPRLRTRNDAPKREPRRARGARGGAGQGASSDAEPSSSSSSADAAEAQRGRSRRCAPRAKHPRAETGAWPACSSAFVVRHRR